MKRVLYLLMLAMCQFSYSQAQSARSVLDKCAAVVSNKSGIKASFRMESARYGDFSGTIMLKDRKFCAQTDVATMWFDGKTQWTYLKKNDEVSITTPTEAQLQVINPYNFINLYKKDYQESMTTGASAYNVHLTATDAAKKIRELFITIDKKNYAPTEVKILQGTKWTTFHITDFKTTDLSDSVFRFNAKDFPSAEIIDLR